MHKSISLLIFILLFVGQSLVAIADEIPTLVRIGLLNEQAERRNEGVQLASLNNFLKEFWQLWGIENQRTIAFISYKENEVYRALENNEIDIVGITTVTGDHPDLLFSIPFAKFRQRIFERLEDNDIDNLQLAIHSPRETTLDSISDHIERFYFDDLNELIDNYQNYDALYSVTPWALERELNNRNLSNKFYISTDEAPDIYFHFATKKSNRALMYAINERLRAINLAQKELWTNKYIPDLEQKVKFTFGSYLQNLTETEKQFVLDHNVVSYPLLQAGFPPYIIRQSLENITERGFSIDILRHATKKTGLIFQPNNVRNLRESQAKIANKQADFHAIASKDRYSPKTHKTTASYFNTNYNMVVRGQNNLTDNINALNDEVIAAVKDLSLTRYLQEKLPTATIKLFNNSSDALHAVAKGDANVYIGYALNIAYVIKQENLFNLTTRPIQGIDLSTEMVFASINSQAPLISLLNRSLSSLSANEYDQIYARWSAMVTQDNSREQVREAYEKAGIVLAFVVFAFTCVAWIYNRQLNYRKKTQHQIEQALAIAETAREEAEKSAAAKIDFLARMSHEIRTPMNGILGMAEGLTYTELDKKQGELLGTLTYSAKSLLGLLNDILDFSKMDSGKLQLESKATDLKALCNQIFDPFILLGKEKNLKMTLSFDSKITKSLMTDPTRLTQVLNNLLSNAIKFTNKGEVKLIIRETDAENVNNTRYKTIKFQIIDTGVGIEESNKHRLFTPFTQEDIAVTRKFGGTGLGLSICQEIVNAMGSKIDVKSTKNIGSEFYFSIHLKEQSDTKPAAAVTSSKPDLIANDDRLSQLRVLVAEDNLVNIQVLQAQLARLNINPDIVEDGLQALTKFEKNTYDVVISDCHMPNVDGYELANKLVKEKVGNRPWLIAITADALVGTEEKCFAAGFDDYISKPCPQAVLSEKCHHAYEQLLLAKPDIVFEEPEYRIFKPVALLQANDNDRVIAKKAAATFVENWPIDKAALETAVQTDHFEHAYSLSHQLKGSLQYLVGTRFNPDIALIQKLANQESKLMIGYSVKLLVKQIHILTEEINHWLKTT